MSKPKELVKSNIQFKSKFRMLNDFFSVIGSQPESVSATAAIRQFRKHYPIFTDSYEQIMQYESELTPEELEELHGKFSEINLMFIKVEEYPTPDQSQSGKVQVDNELRAKLPFIELPKFNGDNMQWLGYHDLFLSLVDQRPNLSDSEKYYYLRASLNGEALSVISHLAMDSSNYTVALELLRKRYNNTRLLADSYLDRILRLPSVNQATDLRREFYDPLREGTQALEKLKLPIKEWSYLLVFIILQKLSIRIRQGFEERFGADLNNLPTFTQLLQLLDEQCRLQAAVPDASGARRPTTAPPKKTGPQRQRATGGVNQANYQVTSCAYCQNTGHSLYRCKGFINLHPYQRRIWAAKKRMCEICLRSHQGKECSSESWCKHCNSQTHNTLLCLNDANPHQSRQQFKPRPQTPQGQANIDRPLSPSQRQDSRQSPRSFREPSPQREDNHQSPTHAENRRPGYRAHQASVRFESMRYGSRSSPTNSE